MFIREIKIVKLNSFNFILFLQRGDNYSNLQKYAPFGRQVFLFDVKNISN